MKKTILGLGIIALTITACEKNGEAPETGLVSDAIGDASFLTMQTDNYQRAEAVAVQRNAEGVPTAGEITYTENGTQVAKVEYDGTNNVVVTDASGTKTWTKEKDCEKCTEDYDKVITEPLVKSASCNYELVAGVIKYYKDNKWVATVDFGDGTCDDTAVKETAEGTHTFTVSDYF